MKEKSRSRRTRCIGRGIMIGVLVLLLSVTVIPLLPADQAFAGKDYTNAGCVQWVKDRAKAKLNITWGSIGNGKDYWDGMYKLGYDRGQEPKANSIAVWRYTAAEGDTSAPYYNYGHVAFVEEVNGNTVTTTEGGVRPYYSKSQKKWIYFSYNGYSGVWKRNRTKSDIKNDEKKFLGYIYLKEKSPRKPSVTEDRKYGNKWSIGETNAVLCAKIFNPASNEISTVGIELSLNGKVIASKSEKMKSSGRYLTTTYAWYDCNKELKKRLEPGTTYSYNIYAYIKGQKYSTGKKNFTTKGSATPNVPSFNTSKRHFATGDAVTVSWSADTKAKKGYSVTIEKVNSSYSETKNTATYNANQVAFTLPTAGEYTIRGYAKGTNKNSAVGTMSKTIVAHNPVNVRFVETDVNGENENLLSEQKVRYGYSAVAPNGVTRKGYTFTGWDKDFTNVTSDLTVTAKFKIKDYNISFYDKDGNLIVSESVPYGGSVDPPDAPEAETGYIFTGWDSNAYENVQGNAKIYASYAWAEQQLPVVVKINSCEFRDDGYYLSYDLKNNPGSKTKGRALVSLHTSENKLLATTESSAFSLAAGEERTGLSIFVPYEGYATKVSVYIVNGFTDSIPISSVVTGDIVRSWSEWTATEPEEGVTYESRTEYRKKDKETTTTRTSVNEGWTLYNTVLDSNWTFGAWSAYSKTKYTASETTTKKREVQTKKVVDKAAYTKYNWYYYRYWNSSAGKYYYTYSSSMGGTKYTWTTTYMLPKVGTYDGKPGYKPSGGHNFSDEIWWLSSKTNVAETSHTEYRYRDGTKGYTYYWYKWGDWSDWTATPISATSSREVDTRTVYRTQSDGNMTEDNSGNTYTVSGSVDPELAGQQAIIQVYKNDEPSDSNNEYVGQTTIGENGRYEFTFITREPISEKTGDYKVVMGIEGASKPIYIETIEAPKPAYEVVFQDDDGNIIDTQTVVEGGSASAPAAPEKENHDFIGWDYGVTNIRDNMVITAQYAPEKCAVAFVNWNSQEATSQIYSYGSLIDFPDPTEIEGYTFTGWTTPEGEEVKTVEGNLVLVANYEIESYDVSFLDNTGAVISQQEVLYGTSADEPEVPAVENMVFRDWSTYDFTECKEDLEVTALYEYEETTADPTCDTESGTFDNAATIHLNAEEGADIYYTTDGTIPTKDSLKYNGQIEISQNTCLQFIAISDGKNPSKIVSRTYLVLAGEDDEGALVIKNQNYSLERGEEAAITYSLFGTAEDSEVVFLSLDESIASVDDEGVVHANKVGSTRVFVRTADNRYASFVNVGVSSSDVDPTEVVLDKQVVQGKPGKTVQVNADVLPDDSTNKAVEWYVEDPEVAEVNDEGTVELLGYGRTTLKAYSAAGTCFAEIPIVSSDSSREGLRLAPEEYTLYIDGVDQQIEASFDGNEADVTWESSNPDAVTVDDEGICSAVGVGSATITATMSDGTTETAFITAEELEKSDFEQFVLLIEGLPEDITLQDEKNVEKARALYDSIADEDKELLTEELAVLEAAEARIAELTTDLPAALEQAEAQIANLQQQLGDLETEKDSIQQQLTQAQTSYNTLLEEKNGLVSQVETLTGEKEALEQREAELTAQKAQLEQEAEANQQTIAQIEAELTDISTQKGQLETRLQEALGAKADVEQQLSQAQTKVNDLTAQKETLETRNSELQGELQTAQDEITRLRKALSESTADDLAEVKVSGIKNKVYTGKALQQALTVKIGGKTLVNGTDYKVVYSNNKNVGTAKLSISGQNEYRGTITKTFKINPKGTSIAKLAKGKKQMTVQWKKQAVQTTGYQIRYSLKKNFKSGVKTVTVKGPKTTKRVIKKLKAKKTYYVQVRTYKTVSGKKYYSAWSKTKYVKTK